MDFGGNWEGRLLLVEFAYNNNYQSSIQMAAYEALYSRRCRSPIHCVEVGERKSLGPDLVQHTVEMIKGIREKMRTSQDKQQKYANQRRW